METEGLLYYVAGVLFFCVVMGGITIQQWASQIHKEGHTWKESYKMALGLFLGATNNDPYQ